MRQSNTPDMYGSVEDQGWDPDGSTPQVTSRQGINRQQQMLNVMEMVAQAEKNKGKPTNKDSNPKPKAQTPNLKVSKSYGNGFS